MGRTKKIGTKTGRADLKAAAQARQDERAAQAEAATEAPMTAEAEAPAAEPKVEATVEPTPIKAKAEAKARTSATGTTPSLASMPVGQKLHRLYRGERYDAEVIAGPEGQHLLRVKGHKEPATSLSSGASLISNHAERGALVWRTPDGKILLPDGPPKYEALAASPPDPAKASAGAKARAEKAAAKSTPGKTGLQKFAEGEAARIRKGNGKAGTVKVTKGVKCGQKGCGQMVAATDLGAHMATHQPA